MAGLHDVIASMRARINKFPDSLALRALLTQIYFERKEEFAGEIFKESLHMLKLYRNATQGTRRYLLYGDIDPFDLAASAYERDHDFSRAITIREEALASFPLNRERHRNLLAADYYGRAISLRGKNRNVRAERDLKKAVKYASEGSEMRALAEGELRRLEKMMGDSR
jgi:tetratricopeptide (TPR) repeat protein